MLRTKASPIPSPPSERLVQAGGQVWHQCQRRWRGQADKSSTGRSVLDLPRAALPAAGEHLPERVGGVLGVILTVEETEVVDVLPLVGGGMRCRSSVVAEDQCRGNPVSYLAMTTAC